MFNPMTYNNATFTDQLTRNLQMAERYKWMAYEKLGITPSSMGNPSQYSTAEGIQVSQNASYAQMYNIDQILMENKRSNIEIHMRVSQYCQLNNKDINYIYMASDNEIEFLQSIKDDPDFDLRQIDVRPTYNAKKNREFHGWGLPSVKDAVEKYNGTLKCINEEKQFIVKIMLFFEKNTN